MSIPGVNKPLGDLDFDYVVQPSDWNDMFNTLYNYLNSTVKDALDGLQNAPAPTVAAQGTFQARLTLQTGVPVPSVPQSAKPTMYLTARGGNLIGCYDLSQSPPAWINRAFNVDLALACPVGVRDLFDIWVSWNGTGLVLSATGYQSQVCTNNPAAGLNVTCNMASTAYFAVGDIISITDGTSQEEARVTVVNAGTSIVLDQLVSSFTAPTIRSNTPVEPIALQDGIPVKASNLGFRYVGTVMVIANALNDTLALRCVGNYYNRTERPFYHANTATSYTQPTGMNLANAIKTIGTSSTIFVAPAANQGTTYRFGRGVGYVARTCEIFEQVDGIPTQSGYINITGIPGAGAHVSGAGATNTGGRHTITDWFNVPSSTAVVTNIADTCQVSYTAGTVLN